jgi:hypothetical protein
MDAVLWDLTSSSRELGLAVIRIGGGKIPKGIVSKFL